MDGVINFSQDTFPPKAKWDTTNVPDMSNKVVLITGGNSGIGMPPKPVTFHQLISVPHIVWSCHRPLCPKRKEVARTLLGRNARVYIACRSLEKAEATAEELKGSITLAEDQLGIIRLDLSDLKSVKQGTEEFLS